MKSKHFISETLWTYKSQVRILFMKMTLSNIRRSFFLKMEPLAKPIIKAIETGKVKFIPEHYKKISLHWLRNIVDWPLSRQIVWGIPIPAKSCEKCGYTLVETEVIRGPTSDSLSDVGPRMAVCDRCGGTMKKETDTFLSGKFK